MESLVVVGPYYQLGVRNSTINISPKSSKNKQANKEAMSQTFSCPRHYFSPPTFSKSNIISNSVIIVKTLNCKKREFELGLGAGGWRKKICLSIGSNKEKSKNTNTHLTHL
jgi:hypothetical protein